jgi:RHS repeat-associated protein
MSRSSFGAFRPLTSPHSLMRSGLALALTVIQCVTLASPAMARSSAPRVKSAGFTATPVNAPAVVNRTVPKVSPPPTAPLFSDAPTDAEIMAAKVFDEPLLRIGGGDTNAANRRAENAELAAAIAEYKRADDPEAVAPFVRFLKNHPNSEWRVSLLTDLGVVHRRTGYFSRALASFEEAWTLGRDAAAPAARAIVDRAVGELAELAARLGRSDRLETLFAEIGARQIDGAPKQKVEGAKSALWLMKHEPGESFLCGPMAVGNVCAAVQSGAERATSAPLIEAARSTMRGTSLTQIHALSKAAGLSYRMAFRTPGATIPLPAVVHWKSGHFAAVVNRVRTSLGERYELRDPTFGDGLLVSDAALDAEGDGYFLIADGPAGDGWRAVAAEEGNDVWGKGLPAAQNPDPYTPCDDKAKGGCGTGSCRGMAVYDFHMMLASLNISDTPVGYAPPRGPGVFFTLTYNQRESIQPVAPTYSNFGPNWTYDWLSFIQDGGAGAPSPNPLHYVSGGGGERYANFNSQTGAYAPQTQSQAILVRTSPTSYERRLPDGSKEIFAQPDMGVGTRRVFLTQMIDSQGNAVGLTYDAQFRLVAVTDAIGQVTTLEYAAPESFRIAKVTDPFGRFATFAYYPGAVGESPNAGRLKTVTDAVGIASEFAYADATAASFKVGFIASLTTPYGTTTFDTFSSPNVPMDRWVSATDPFGDTERVESRRTTPIPNVEPAPAMPNITNGALGSLNSFYWDKKAWRDFPGDYTRAQATQFLRDSPGLVSGVAASRKSPLEGRVWISYPGQADAIFTLGLRVRKPSHVGRVLDDGTSQVTQYEYNAIGRTTRMIDPLGRETRMSYAANLIDVTAVEQKVGARWERQASYAYNPEGVAPQHVPISMTDAAGRVTRMTYSPTGQILSVTNARNETTTYDYDQFGYLIRVTGPVAGATTTYEYDVVGRVRKVTDSDGYAVTTEYDALDRPVRMTYPDGTTREMSYVRPSDGKMTLDVWTTRDRQGRETRTEYDALRRVSRVTDAQGRTTQFGWCNCGGLSAMTDAKGQVTTWERDLQGRVTLKRLADGATTNYEYERTTSRLRRMTDARGVGTNYQYNPDDTLRRVSYSLPAAVQAQTSAQPRTSEAPSGAPQKTLVTPTVTYEYDGAYNRVTAMRDGIGVTRYAYHPVNGTLGAGQVAAVDGPLQDDTISYAYDELGRVVNRTIGASGNVQTMEYDALGRTARMTNAQGTFVPTYDGVTGRVVRMAYPNGQRTEMDYADNAGDRRMLTLRNVDPGNGTLSKFDYEYEKEGTIVAWSRQLGNAAAKTERYGYDAADQLIEATLTAGDATERRIAYEYDLGGNRTNERAVVGQLPQTTDYEALEFDAVNRVTAVVKGTRRSEFFYDGLGRRVRMVEREGATLVSDKRYIWDGGEIVEERDGVNTNGVTKRYFGAGVQEVAANATTNLFYSRDHLGSVREATDANGNLVARYDYDPWGRQTQVFGTYRADWGYAGYFVHRASKLNLTWYRAYDPDLGRWVSRDPIEEDGGLNLYEYVENNPINDKDPNGLYGNKGRRGPRFPRPKWVDKYSKDAKGPGFGRRIHDAPPRCNPSFSCLENQIIMMMLVVSRRTRLNELRDPDGHMGRIDEEGKAISECLDIIDEQISNGDCDDEADRRKCRRRQDWAEKWLDRDPRKKVFNFKIPVMVNQPGSGRRNWVY